MTFIKWSWSPFTKSLFLLSVLTCFKMNQKNLWKEPIQIILWCNKYMSHSRQFLTACTLYLNTNRRIFTFTVYYMYVQSVLSLWGVSQFSWPHFYWVLLDSYNMIPLSNNYCLCFKFSLKLLVKSYTNFAAVSPSVLICIYVLLWYNVFFFFFFLLFTLYSTFECFRPV